MHEDRAARRSVAAGAADFLVIRFETSRQSRVDDGSNVRFVDAHSERDCGNHHVDLAGEKLLLNAAAKVGVESGMIGSRRKRNRELGRQTCSLFARRRIDDRRTAFRIAQQFRRHCGSLRRHDLHGFDRKIGAAKTVNESRQFRKSKLFRNVVLYQWCCGCGQGDDGRRPQFRKVLAESAIVRTEVMPPLRNAVGLVNSDQSGFALRQHFRKSGQPQSFRRDEKKLQRAVQVIRARLSRRGGVAAGMDAFDLKATFFQLRHLIFHQRNERADHECRSAAGDAGQLVA